MTGSSTQWLSVAVKTPEHAADEITDFAHRLGSAGSETRGTGSVVTVLLYFRKKDWQEAESEFRKYLQSLAEVFPDTDPEVTIQPVKSEDWAVMWREHFQPLPIGRKLLVVPPWLNPDPEGREKLIIEPAEAFGTGSHETTRDCLVLLEETAERMGMPEQSASVLDLGCGSGILAIAAVNFGFSPVTAIDVDPIAVAAAEKNADLNKCRHLIEWRTEELTAYDTPADIVLANLDPLTLERHADHIIGLTVQTLIVSGVPRGRWPALAKALESRGTVRDRECIGKEWASARFAVTRDSPPRAES